MRGRVDPHDPLRRISDGREQVELDAYREFVRLADAGRPVALVTVVDAEGSAPRGMGGAMAVRADGSIVGTVGGGSLELLVIEQALEALRDGRARLLHYDFSGGPEQNLDKACTGKTDFFIQPALPRPKLFIFGAGHIGRALAPIAAGAGFRVTVVDPRPGFAVRDRFPAEVELREGPFQEVIAELPFDERTYAVIVTHGHTEDEAVLRACLPRPWAYLGMIGSRAKVARLFRAVATSEEARRRLARVHAPIGLDLGGRSPGEIALAIAAELQAVRYGREKIEKMSRQFRPAVLRSVRRAGGGD